MINHELMGDWYSYIKVKKKGMGLLFGREHGRVIVGNINGVVEAWWANIQTHLIRSKSIHMKRY